MNRFFALSQNIRDNVITLSKEDINHIINVLRLKDGDIVMVCDGEMTDYCCEITQISNKDLKLNIISASKNEAEPRVKVTLFQGLPKQDKMELIIQKCVELGIDKIVPVITQRAIAKAGEKADKKIDRWQKISQAAAMQSGRGKIPEIGAFLRFSEALSQMQSMDLALMPYELENSLHMWQALEGFTGESIGIFIGPEGGIGAVEANQCANNGIVAVSLGKRILRTETAGFAALTMVLYQLGEL